MTTKHSRQSAPSTEIWRLERNGHEARCVLVSIPVGLETRVIFDGHFLYSFQFPRLHEAVSFAESRRTLMAREGWTCAKPLPGPRLVWPASA